MFQNISSMLTPQMIINFIKNNADMKKLGLNLINSEQAKKFITEDLGYDYNNLKQNLFAAIASTKKSEFRLEKTTRKV